MKAPCLLSQNHVIMFFSACFLRWWALCARNVTFPAFCGCESSWSNAFHGPFISSSCSFHVHFMLYSFPFMFVSFAFCSFHVLFTWHAYGGFLKWGYPNWMVFVRENPKNGWFGGTPIYGNTHILSFAVAVHQTKKRLGEVISSNPSGGHLRPIGLAFSSYFSLSFLLSCCYRFEGKTHVTPPSWFMNMYMFLSSLSSYFTLVVVWAGNAVVVLRSKPNEN